MVTVAETGHCLWVQKLGHRPKELEHRPDQYRPQFKHGYLAFRNADGDWLLSRSETMTVRHILRGGESRLIWSPGGQRLAILDGSDSGRLLVLESPHSKGVTEVGAIKK